MIRADDGPAATTADVWVSTTLKAARITELRAETKAYSGELIFVGHVTPGTRVEKGAALASLAGSEFARAMELAEENVEAAKLGIEQITELLTRHDIELARQLEIAERSLARAEQDLAHFAETARAARIRGSEIDLELTENSIQDQREELAQLERLYQGNDLAKESQDIVLNRARRRLAVTIERHELAKQEHERLVEVILPRREEDLMAAYEGARVELERLKRAAESGNAELIARLIRAHRSHADATEHLEKLKKDQGVLHFNAPHAGVLLSGPAGGNDGVSMRYSEGEKVARNAVIVSIVDASNLEATFSIPPTQRSRFKPNDTLSVRVDALGKAVEGKVVSVGSVVRDGGITVRILIENDGTLLHGLKAEVALPRE